MSPKVKHFNRKTKIENEASLNEALSRIKRPKQCLIVIEDEGTCDYFTLDESLIPPGTIPIIDRGVETYLLGQNLGKILWALDHRPTNTGKESPQDCFKAGSWGKLRTIIYPTNSVIEKIKLGIFIGLAIGMMILIFMVTTVSNGGVPNV